MNTARQSPLPAWDAWPRWTRNAFWSGPGGFGSQLLAGLYERPVGILLVLDYWIVFCLRRFVLAGRHCWHIQSHSSTDTQQIERFSMNCLEINHVTKRFGGLVAIEDLNLQIDERELRCIIGPNGAGKTTIFKMIMGEETPDKGEFKIGDTVKLAYVDQKHSNIDPEKSIWQNFSDEQELIMMGNRQVNSRAYLSRFNFSGSEQNKKVKLLSGGERNRLHLAMTLKEEGNVLLLDEPTNDLDVNTLRALEEGLENFAGCAVVISHDRWFLDRICTHILAFEGDSQVYFFEGSFSEYEENKKKRLGGDLTPKRIRYKKLVR